MDHTHMHVLEGLEEAAHLQAAHAHGSSAAGPSISSPPPSPALRKKGPWFMRWTVLGLEPSGELLAIGMVYFVQGILGLADLASSFFFKDDLKLEPAESAVLLGLSNVPWMIKPLYGFITDSIPFCGYRRRSYLVASGVLGTVSWAVLAAFVGSAWAATTMMVLASLATAFSDVVVDSIVVERSRNAPATVSGALQSLCWASQYSGAIASAYFSGHLVDRYGNRFVFGLTAVFPLIVSVTALLIDEQPVQRQRKARSGGGSSNGTARPAAAAAGQGRYSAVSLTDDAPASGGVPVSNGPPTAESSASYAAAFAAELPLGQRLLLQMRNLWAALSKRGILLPTIFIFMWQSTPTADTAMFYFYTNQLGFTAEFLGWVRLAGSLASLGGVLLYNFCLKKVPIKTMMFWCMVLGALLGSTQLVLVSGLNRKLGLSDELFVLGDNVVITTLVQISFMPVLVLAARLCPEGVEATLFATLMSVINGSGSVGSALGAALTALLGVTSTNFDHLFLLVALCNASMLLPLPFLALLPPEEEEAEAEKKRDGDGRGAAGKSECEMGPLSEEKEAGEATGLLDRHRQLDGNGSHSQ